jgi:hypothetical protein
MTQSAQAAITGALNDRSRTSIGDPWRGTYHVAIDVTNYGDTEQLLRELEALGVTARVNSGSVDRLAIYDLESLTRLFALGDALDEWALKRLEILVRARGPVSEAVASRVQSYVDDGLRYDQIAALMNQRRVASGMGGKGWTADKVRRVARGEEASRSRKRAAA